MGALKPSIAIALRLIGLPLLAITLHLPSGIVDHYTLGRPMGRHVLQQGLIFPAAAVSHAAQTCVTSMGSGFQARCVLPASEMSPGSQLLHALLLALVCLLVPLHLVGTLGLLCCSSSYSQTEADEGFIKMAFDKQAQIEAWAAARSKMLEGAGLCEIWRAEQKLQRAEEADH